MMDYPFDKFGGCSFNHIGSIVQTQTDVDERFIPATVVGVSNKIR